MYYVYFIKSLRNNDIYIGSTMDVSKRLAIHNAGKVKSTKFYKPWRLLDYEAYDTRSHAIKMERFFKTGQQRELLRSKYDIM